MKLADLLVVTGKGRAVGLFTCPESLVFAVATSLVATLVRAAKTIARTDLDSTTLALAAAFAVGAAIFAVSMSDRGARPDHGRGWITAIAAAALNCLLLCVAAVGIEKL